MSERLTRQHMGDGRVAAFQRLDAFGQGLDREVGIRPHHARQGDLEREARVRGRLQLRHQVPEHAEQPARPIGPEPLELAGELAAHRLRDVDVGIVADERHDVQVADVLGHVADELREVGARLDVVGRPAEAVGDIALPHIGHYLGQVVRVDGPEQALGPREGDLAVLERYDLLERRKGVSQPAFRAVGDQVERLALELDALGDADGAEARHHRLGRDAAEIEPLAPRVDGLGDFLGIGRAQHEHDVRRRFLERLEQRVERGRRQHVDLVDDVDLEAAPGRGELDAADNLLADVLDARAARGVELVDVRVRALGDELAIVARAVGVGRRTFLAQQRLGEQSRRRRLSRAARAREQVGVRNLVLLDRVLERPLDGLLAHDVLEHLRTVFPVQRFCHAHLRFLNWVHRVRHVFFQLES